MTPVKVKAKRTQAMTIHFPFGDLEWLRREAERRCCSISTVARDLIREAVERRNGSHGHDGQGAGDAEAD